MNQIDFLPASVSIVAPRPAAAPARASECPARERGHCSHYLDPEVAVCCGCGASTLTED